MSDRVSVGMVGLGGWGKNLLRNFASLPQADLRYACDSSQSSREMYAPAHPGTIFTAEYQELLNDPTLDAVVLATPVPDHFEMARAAITAGKHVMVEKPMTWRAAEARELRTLVHSSGKVLMVGHLLRFHPGVEKLRGLIDSGELGEIRYVYGNRVNLGVIREQENVLWSLGVHDISVVLHLIDSTPIEVSARGHRLSPPGGGGRRVRPRQIRVGPDRPPAPVVARSPQDAQDDGGGGKPDGGVRRHGAGTQGDRLRQGRGDDSRRHHLDPHRRHHHP